MNQKAQLFTVADPDIGLGHLFRCDALAYAFQQINVSAELVIECKAGKEWLREKPVYSNWRLSNWTDNAQFIEQALDNCEIPIFDAYAVDSYVWTKIHETGRKVVVFDDYGEKPALNGILINGSPGAGILKYQDIHGRELLLGPSYQTLRPPFWKKTERSVRKNVESVGIMIGGTDHRGLLPDIVETVRDFLPVDVKIHVIGKEIMFPAVPNVCLTGFLDAREIKNLFDSLDVLISAAGQSVAEAVSCVLPMIIFCTEKNQVINYTGWVQKKVGIDGNKILNKNGINRCVMENNLSLLTDYSTRLNMAFAAAAMELHDSTQNLCCKIKKLLGSNE